MSGEIDLAKGWLQKAKNDLLNADNNLRSKNIPFDTVCYHCNQAAEKLLKAYLVAKQYEYPLTHDLFVIQERIIQLEPSVNDLNDSLAVLMPYGVGIRYPDEFYMPELSDANEAREAAAVVYEWLKKVLPELFN